MRMTLRLLRTAMRNLETTTSPRYAGGSLRAPVAKEATPGEAAVLGMNRFETAAAALKEDQLRLGYLRWLTPAEPPLGWPEIGNVAALNEHRLRYTSRPLAVPQLDGNEVAGLVHKLEANVEAESAIYPTVASSAAMRGIRIKVIGALLDAVAELGDDELKVVTVVKPTWAMTPSELLRTDARAIKFQFVADLKRTGVSALSDPFVAFLHGEFDPTKGLYLLHYHCVTTPRKAALLKKRLGALAAYKATGLVRRPIRSPRVGDRVWQLTYLLKALWPNRAVRLTANGWKRDRGYHRIREPWSSIYLLWLDRHRLLDLTVATGTWSRRKGGSEGWKAFSLMVEGVGDEKGSGG